jgi:hypothetical protein
LHLIGKIHTYYDDRKKRLVTYVYVSIYTDFRILWAFERRRMDKKISFSAFLENLLFKHIVSKKEKLDLIKVEIEEYKEEHLRECK